MLQTKKNKKIKIPLFTSTIKAGFPSPASDLVEQELDLNELLIRHPEATFFVKVSGDSMKDANIFTGDILVVDRSKEVQNNNIVVAIIDGEFTVKRYRKIGSNIFLIPENKKYNSVKITNNNDFQIWGIVTSIIHQT